MSYRVPVRIAESFLPLRYARTRDQFNPVPPSHEFSKNSFSCTHCDTCYGHHRAGTSHILCTVGAAIVQEPLLIGPRQWYAAAPPHDILFNFYWSLNVISIF